MSEVRLRVASETDKNEEADQARRTQDNMLVAPRLAEESRVMYVMIRLSLLTFTFGIALISAHGASIAVQLATIILLLRHITRLRGLGEAYHFLYC